MEFDFRELRGLIISKYESCAEFSRAIGWKEQYLSAKLRNKVKFTCKDIVLFCEKLEITKFEIGRYFFTLKV